MDAGAGGVGGGQQEFSGAGAGDGQQEFSGAGASGGQQEVSGAGVGGGQQVVTCWDSLSSILAAIFPYRSFTVSLISISNSLLFPFVKPKSFKPCLCLVCQLSRN